MITERDREIINYIYKIGFGTIEQISSMFFTNKKSGYDLARRRLKAIKNQSDYLRTIQNTETNQLVYIPKESTLKRVTLHSLKLIDYLCELKKLGCDIETIDLEYDFGGAVPDAFIVFKFNGYRYYQLIEMQLRHDVVDIDRYGRVINNILKRTNGVTPTIVIIQNTNKQYPETNIAGMDIRQLKLDMNDIAKVLI